MIVVPCVNEAERWNSDYWRDLLNVDGIKWLFVNDGSTDKTHEILAEFVEKHSRDTQHASVLSLHVNVGKGEAIRTGWLHTLNRNHSNSSDISGFGFIDADGAFEKSDIERIVNTFDEKVKHGSFQTVWSSRAALAGRNIKRHANRNYIGRLVATFLSTGGQVLPYDTQFGLKIFVNTPEVVSTYQKQFEIRWQFELEMVTRHQAVFEVPPQI